MQSSRILTTGMPIIPWDIVYDVACDYPKACAAFSSANDLLPRQPSVLLGLAIARQLNVEYPAAIDAIRQALEINPDFVNGYNTLALTQKLMGAYEKSAHNYEAGLKALARVIAKSMHNAEDSSRLPHWQSRNHLDVIMERVEA